MTKDAEYSGSINSTNYRSSCPKGFIEAYDETPTHKKEAEFVEPVPDIEKRQ
jgi:hypothetical protein